MKLNIMVPRAIAPRYDTFSMCPTIMVSTELNNGIERLLRILGMARYRIFLFKPVTQYCF